MLEDLSIDSHIQAASLLLGLNYFSKVAEIVPQPYLDEIFHIPQTQLYCRAAVRGESLLTVPWDPKITTPPGLYVLGQLYSQYLATPLLSYFKRSDIDPCGPMVLRSVNFLGVMAVLPIVLGAIQRINKRHTEQQVEAGTLLTLMGFPLLFFFSTLFYTDVWSTVFVLLALAFGSVDPEARGASKIIRRALSALIALISITFRQTNILWAGYVAVSLLEEEHRSLEAVKSKVNKDKASKSSKPSNGLLPELPEGTPDLIKFAYTAVTTPSITIPYGLVAVAFAAFLHLNGGIAMGDKENHQFSLNPAQIFHLALHVVFFTGPVVFAGFHLPAYYNYFTRHPFVFTSSVAIIGLLVFYTTGDAHPFTLADNRHFTFYIWRKLIQPSKNSLPFALVVAAPIYHTGLWLLWPREESTQDGAQSNIYTRIFYFVAVIASLVPSPLLEPRYYILPYVIWRARHYRSVDSKLLPILELAWYMVINVLVFYLFLYKPFAWPSEPGRLQRFMW